MIYFVTRVVEELLEAVLREEELPEFVLPVVEPLDLMLPDVTLLVVESLEVTLPEVVLPMLMPPEAMLPEVILPDVNSGVLLSA